MIVQIHQEAPSALADYACVPIAFEVRERFAVKAHNAGLGGLHLHAERVVEPYVKDYDAQPGQHPTAWAARFDLARWGILTAWADGERVGGAVVAWDTPGLEMSEGRSDMAVLWDLRVTPDWRRRGVGTSLFPRCGGVGVGAGRTLAQS
ncbi:MAG: GNAT family N-acetyltransferase [Longimicrobiales bacterium]